MNTYKTLSKILTTTSFAFGAISPLSATRAYQANADGVTIPIDKSASLVKSSDEYFNDSLYYLQE